jgi:cephalosporin hydroxylase
MHPVSARTKIVRRGRHLAYLGAGVRGSAVARLRRATRPYVHRAYVDDLIVKTDNFGDVRWLGHPIWQNVLDLWSIQEAIAELRPALLLETGTNRAGSALFYAHLFDLLGNGRIVTVDVERLHDLTHPRVEFLSGSSVEEPVLTRMREQARLADGPVMVILDSDHAESHVAAELEAYAGLVTPGSLLLVQDGVIDVMPRFAHARPGPLPAIEKFLASHPEFQIDAKFDHRFLVTHHPSGWLRRS